MTPDGKSLTVESKGRAARPEFTVAAGYARALLDLAVSKGADAKTLAMRSGIDPDDLADQDNRIPFEKYVALMRAGKDLARDPALALHFGETVDLSEISIVGLIGRASQTMSEAFAQLQRYGRLVVEVDVGTAGRFQLARGDGGVWLVDTRPNPNDFPELTESGFASVVSGCTRMIRDSGWAGELPPPRAVHVTHADPGYRAEYERIFRTPVVFESDSNAMLVDEKWSSHRLSPRPRYGFGVLSEHAEALLKRLENSKSARGRVESLLLPILHTGDIGRDVIAAMMGVSCWTLSRKLKAEGATFEQVLDDLRRKMALHYLNGKKVSVNETAYLVGFSEPAAFSRAFKRWTGSSPSAMTSRARGRPAKVP
jgi:AraC-like DNA-binding protein